MKNLAIAQLLQFSSADFTKDRFQLYWTNFRDTQVSKFLIIFMDKRIEELRLTLEVCRPEESSKIQGQIFEAKKLKGFLEQHDLSNEIGTVSAYIGLNRN